MNSTSQQHGADSTEEVANTTNFQSIANSTLAAGSSGTTNNGRLRLNFDLNLTTEEPSSQVLEMASFPDPYCHGDPHLAASRSSSFSTLPSDDGGLLRRRREPEQNAEAFQRNTRMRTENVSFGFPSLGRNLFPNSQFGIGTSSGTSSQLPQQDGPADPRWAVPQAPFAGPSRVTNGSLPLPSLQQVPRARYELRILSTETHSPHPASSQLSSMLYNQDPHHYPRPVPIYNPRPLQLLLDQETSLNNGRLIGLVKHLINTVVDSNPPPPLPFPQVDNIVANTLMPAVINLAPRRNVIGPPVLLQLDIADQGPGNGLLPQVDYTNFVMYRDNGFETGDELEGSDEVVVALDEHALENEEGELLPAEDEDNGLTEETIMQYLPSSNYVRRIIDSSNENEACCICQDNFNEGDKLGRLRCCHCYHFHCIKQWLLTKNKCPICKCTALDV